MSEPEAEGERPAGRTIVIRRGGPSAARRLLLPLLLASVLLNLVLFAGRNAAPPDGLEERYLAGEILPGRPTIAVLEVLGPLRDEALDPILAQVRRARDDAGVRGAVLRIRSPGGTVSATDRLWRELESLRAQGKPVVAAIAGQATGGAFAVASATTKVVAEPTALVGGLAVRARLDVAEQAPEPGRIRELKERAFERLIRIVARGRAFKLEAARRVADGRILTADEAVEQGLVDRIGYLDDAIIQVQRLLGLETARIIRYAPAVSLGDLVGERRAAPPDPAPAADGMEEGLPRLFYLPP